MVKAVKKRFEVETGAEGTYIIYDNQGPDENYYHVGNDERDVKALCELLNELSEENKRLDHKANFWHKKYRVVKTTIMRDDDL